MAEFQTDQESTFPVKAENRGKFVNIKLVKDERGWVPGWIAKTTNKATSDSQGYASPSLESFKNAWENDMEGLEMYFSEYLLPYQAEYKVTKKFSDNSMDVEQTLYTPEVVEQDFPNLGEQEKSKILAELDALFGKCVEMYQNYKRSKFGHYLPDITRPNLMYGSNINEPKKKQWFIIDTQPALVGIFSDNVKDRLIGHIKNICETYDPEKKFKFSNVEKLIELLKQ